MSVVVSNAAVLPAAANSEARWAIVGHGKRDTPR